MADGHAQRIGALSKTDQAVVVGPYAGKPGLPRLAVAKSANAKSASAGLKGGGKASAAGKSGSRSPAAQLGARSPKSPTPGQSSSRSPTSPKVFGFGIKHNQQGQPLIDPKPPDKQLPTVVGISGFSKAKDKTPGTPTTGNSLAPFAEHAEQNTPASMVIQPLDDTRDANWNQLDIISGHRGSNASSGT